MCTQRYAYFFAFIFISLGCKQKGAHLYQYRLQRIPSLFPISFPLSVTRWGNSRQERLTNNWIKPKTFPLNTDWIKI